MYRLGVQMFAIDLYPLECGSHEADCTHIDPLTSSRLCRVRGSQAIYGSVDKRMACSVAKGDEFKDLVGEKAVEWGDALR